ETALLKPIRGRACRRAGDPERVGDPDRRRFCPGGLGYVPVSRGSAPALRHSILADPRRPAGSRVSPSVSPTCCRLLSGTALTCRAWTGGTNGGQVAPHSSWLRAFRYYRPVALLRFKPGQIRGVCALMKYHVLYRGPLSSCNYGCHYCPFAKHAETHADLQGD